MPGVFSGIKYFIRGFGLLNRPGVRRYVYIPLLVNSLLFAALIGFGGTEFSHLLNWLLSFLPSWLDWLRWLLWPLFALLALIVVFFTFSIVANLIGAPFNSLLSAAVERHLHGHSAAADLSWTQSLHEILPALVDELRKLAYLAVWGFPLLILTVMPVLNFAAPVLWGGFGAWMLVVQYGDYPMGNHGINFRAQRRLLRACPGTSMGFGGAALIATMTPFLNFLVMPAAVAGATVMWVERLQQVADRD